MLLQSLFLQVQQYISPLTPRLAIQFTARLSYRTLKKWNSMTFGSHVFSYCNNSGTIKQSNYMVVLDLRRDSIQLPVTVIILKCKWCIFGGIILHILIVGQYIYCVLFLYRTSFLWFWLIPAYVTHLLCYSWELVLCKK